MRGAVGTVALLLLTGCESPEQTPIGPGSPPGVIDADGGRTFANRETFQRYCPLRSAVLSRAFDTPFRPIAVYLGPAEPDGEPPAWAERNMALCRYEGPGDEPLVFTAAYQRQSTPEQARQILQSEREGWSDYLIAIPNSREADRAFMHFEDHPNGGWLVLQFVQEDVLVDYVLIGSTPERSADALRELPRPRGARL